MSRIDRKGVGHLQNETAALLSRRDMLQVLAAVGLGGLMARDGSVAAEPWRSKPPLVWVIDAGSFTTDERLTMAALQGLANRNGSRVFLNYGRSLAFLRFGFHFKPGESFAGWNPAIAAKISKKYRSIDDFWIAELARLGLFRFRTCTVEQLIARCSAHIKGVILYHNIDDDLAVAATMAGLRDAIPVTPMVRRQWFSRLQHPPATVFDVGSLYPQYQPGLPRRVAAHRWAIAHLLPECSRHGVFSRVLDYGSTAFDTLPDVDLAIQQRWFTLQLDYGNSNSHPTHNPGKLKEIALEGGLIDKILNHLEPWAPVYGWGLPGENALVNHISRRGHVLICTANGNGTFYHGMPVLTKPFGQPGGKKKTQLLQDKIYIAFMVNEGDTLKCLTALENFGAWIQPERGRFPINWGMDPLLYRQFPGLVSYYYKTATPQDYFFAADSCWGYTHPDAMSEKLLIPYARLIHQGLRASGLTIGDIWWDDNLKKRGLWNTFLKTSGLHGLTQWSSGFQSVEYPAAGIPVAYSPDYYKLKDPAVMARQLLAQAKQISGPWFVVIYTGNPYLFDQVMKRLPPARFEPLRLDDFMNLARAARPKIEGLRWQHDKLFRKPLVK